jgi:hypothetical protein
VFGECIPVPSRSSSAGDGGTFKIAEGHNECGIEEDASVIDF